MYKLDFETLKQVMAAHQKTGALSAEVAAGIVGRREAYIEITLKSGRIASCELRGSDGWSKKGQEAEEEIARLGQRRLNWTFTPMSEVVIPPEPKPPAVMSSMSSVLGAGVYTLFPRRTGHQAIEKPMRTWPHLHKLVFGYADGTKSVAKIAEILAVSPEQIIQAAGELQSIGVIEITLSQNGNFR